MEKKTTDLIEEVIQEKIADLETVTTAEEYYTYARAIKELSDIPNSDYKAQTDAYAREEDIRLREEELAAKEKENAKQRELEEKKEKNGLIRYVAMLLLVGSLSGLTIAEQHNGWIFKQDGILSKLTGLVIKA